MFSMTRSSKFGLPWVVLSLLLFAFFETLEMYMKTGAALSVRYRT